MNIEFIPIPSGTLIMGDNRLSDAAPQHRVEIAAFRMAKFPVTNADYAGFVEAGGYAVEHYWTAMGWKWLASRLPGETEGQGRVPGFWYHPHFNRPNHPVVGISWYEAVAFCNWLSETSGAAFRLPSEAEWEYAARGSEDARNFPWGDRFQPGRANTAEAGIGGTTRVDAFSLGVSPFGVWDLSGNVFEWTRSRWGVNWQELSYPYPYQVGGECEELEGSGARVMRGGSWFNSYPEALCAYRSRYLAGSRGSNIGFRVMRGE